MNTQIDFDLLVALLNDCYAAEIDQDHLVYPEVDEDTIILGEDESIDRADIEDIYINSDCNRIFIVAKDSRGELLLTTIRLLIPVNDTVDLANMLK